MFGGPAPAGLFFCPALRSHIGMAKKYETPRADSRDLPDTVARAAISLVPGGSALQEFLQRPIEVRRERWMDMIGHGLEQVERQIADFNPETLLQNEAFVTAMLHASQIAIRNHQTEKREALRNAVLNVACDRAPDEDLQLMFLNFVDTLTPWHIRILRFLQSLRYSTTAVITGGLATLLEGAFEELRGQRLFYDQVGKDLFFRGLSSVESFHVTMTGFATKGTTDMGDAFLDFISSPVEDID